MAKTRNGGFGTTLILALLLLAVAAVFFLQWVLFVGRGGATAGFLGFGG